MRNDYQSRIVRLIEAKWIGRLSNCLCPPPMKSRPDEGDDLHKESYQRSASRSLWTISLSAAPASKVASMASVQAQEESMKHAALAGLFGAGLLAMLATSTGA